MPPPVKYKTQEEKKLAKQKRDRNYSESRVYLKGQLERWLEVGQQQHLTSNEEIARFLLDMWVYKQFYLAVCFDIP